MPLLCTKCKVRIVKGLLHIGPKIVTLCPEHRKELLTGCNETSNNSVNCNTNSSSRNRKAERS